MSYSRDGIDACHLLSQDTKFNPGGDKETSWMYELGFPREYFRACAAWAEQAILILHPYPHPRPYTRIRLLTRSRIDTRTCSGSRT